MGPTRSPPAAGRSAADPSPGVAGPPQAVGGAARSGNATRAGAPERGGGIGKERAANGREGLFSAPVAEVTEERLKKLLCPFCLLRAETPSVRRRPSRRVSVTHTVAAGDAHPRAFMGGKPFAEPAARPPPSCTPRLPSSPTGSTPTGAAGVPARRRGGSRPAPRGQPADAAGAAADAAGAAADAAGVPARRRGGSGRRRGGSGRRCRGTGPAPRGQPAGAAGTAGRRCSGTGRRCRGSGPTPQGQRAGAAGAAGLRRGGSGPAPRG